MFQMGAHLSQLQDLHYMPDQPIHFYVTVVVFCFSSHVQKFLHSVSFCGMDKLASQFSDNKKDLMMLKEETTMPS